jgi:hypothetical protein
MPTHIRALLGYQVGSTLPRDVVQITPSFRHSAILPGDDPAWQEIADDLADAYSQWAVNGLTRQLSVRLYQIGLPKPNRPKAVTVLNVGQSLEATHPRELACCLSFTGGSNEPRNRGRLYIPQFLVNEGTPGVRPSETERTKVSDLVGIFAGLGGVNVDWIVWSPTAGAATKVERWWVDDEWDVQRRRGMQPTARTEGTTGG